jgi:glycosyltransferase involved in cell wall biosynthesis
MHELAVEIVVGRYRPDRDGVSGYVEQLVSALPEVGVTATVTEWPGLRAFRPSPAADVVHVQFAPSAYGYSGGVGLLPLRGRVPVVTTLHEYGWWSWDPLPAVAPLGPAQRWLHGWAERSGRWDRETLLLSPASRALVVTGRGHAEVVERRLGRPPAVIPIGANVGRSYSGDRASARAELDLPSEAPLLLFFGFVHPVKGLRYLFEALAGVRRVHPEVVLVVVGGWRSLAWPDREADEFLAELQAHIREQGLPESAVRFTGFVPETAASRWLTAADLAVLPFTHGITAKSGSLLTCWTHGLPVVATDPPEGADPDVFAAVRSARVRDTVTLQEAIEQLLADPAERARLSQTGERRMAGRSWPAIAAAHRDLYRKVLG